MGKTNQNAGMHFVRYGRNVYEPGGYDKYIDILAESALRKNDDIHEKRLGELINKTSRVMNKGKEEVSIGQQLDELFKNAQLQQERLYAALYLYALVNHRDIQQLATSVTGYLKTNTSGAQFNEVLFLAMMARLLGINMAQLAALREEEAKDIVYTHVLPHIGEDSIIHCYHSEDADYIEIGLSLINYSNEDMIRSYYMNLRDAVLYDRDDSLPDIWVHYDITILRMNKADNREYAVMISFFDRKKENYLNMYEAIVYKEKMGKVADFFEQTFK